MIHDIWLGTLTRVKRYGSGLVLTGKGAGIYRYALNDATGAFSKSDVLEPADNPSYIALSRDDRFLYAVSDIDDYEGQSSGALSAYRVTPEGLSLISRQATMGANPCHIALRESFAIVSNYDGGNYAFFPIRADGSISKISREIIHTEGSGLSRRQMEPHAHSAAFSPDGSLAFFADLGADTIDIYALENGLSAEPLSVFKAGAGAGPRVCAPHPTKPIVYFVNELSSSVSVLHYTKDGSLTQIQQLTTLPEGAAGSPSIAAEIVLSMDARFLYVSNRGHDSIAMFAIDERSALLSRAEFFGCHGKTPRSIALDPSGKYLVAANQDSDELVSFLIDPNTGRLCFADSIYAPTPACVRLAKRDS